jgi:hypothetical protein
MLPIAEAVVAQRRTQDFLHLSLHPFPQSRHHDPSKPTTILDYQLTDSEAALVAMQTTASGP